jgi:hypothetical protein
MMKLPFWVLSSVPLMVVARRPVLAEESTGKFCRLLAPVSASPGSFSFSAPSSSRSMPSPVLL